MTREGEDLFAFAQAHGGGADPAPAALRFVPPFIAPHLDGQDRAFGDPLEAWVEFDKWLHAKNGGEIANRFLRLSVKMRRRGWTKYSAQGVIETIRWHEHLRHGPDARGFKISHIWRRRLSIWAMIRAPKDLEGFFRVQGRCEESENQEGEA